MKKLKGLSVHHLLVVVCCLRHVCADAVPNAQPSPDPASNPGPESNPSPSPLPSPDPRRRDRRLVSLSRLRPTVENEFVSTTTSPGRPRINDQPSFRTQQAFGHYYHWNDENHGQQKHDKLSAKKTGRRQIAEKDLLHILSLIKKESAATKDDYGDKEDERNVYEDDYGEKEDDRNVYEDDYGDEEEDRNVFKDDRNVFKDDRNVFKDHRNDYEDDYGDNEEDSNVYENSLDLLVVGSGDDMTVMVDNVPRRIGEVYVKKRGTFDFSRFSKAGVNVSDVSQPYRASPEEKEERRLKRDRQNSKQSQSLQRQTQNQQRHNNDDILDELEQGPDLVRRGRQNDPQVFVSTNLGDRDGDDGGTSGDTGRSIGGGGQNGCKTSGYMPRTREDCQEVEDTVCKSVQVTKYRKEIDQQCKTKLDQECKTTKIQVPKQQCEQRYEKRCETEYEYVKEKVYKEECHETVEHVCEKLVEVPVRVPYEVPVQVPYEVPVPVEVPYKVAVPYPEYYSTTPPPYKPSPKPEHYPQYHQSPSPKPQYHPSPSPKPQYHPSPSPKSQYHPSPSPKPQYHPSPSPKPQYHPSPSPKPQYHPNPSPTPHYHPSPSLKRNYHDSHTIKPQYHPSSSPKPQYHPSPSPQTRYHSSPQPNYHASPSPKPQYHPSPSSKTNYHDSNTPKPHHARFSDNQPPTPAPSLPHPSTISSLPKLDAHRSHIVDMFNSQVWKRDIHHEIQDDEASESGAVKQSRIPKFQEVDEHSRGKRESSADSSAQPNSEAEADPQFSNILSGSPFSTPTPAFNDPRAFKNILSATDPSRGSNINGRQANHFSNRLTDPLGIRGGGGPHVLGGTIRPGAIIPSLNQDFKVLGSPLTDAGGLGGTRGRTPNALGGQLVPGRVSPNNQLERTLNLDQLVDILGIGRHPEIDPLGGRLPLPFRPTNPAPTSRPPFTLGGGRFQPLGGQVQEGAGFRFPESPDSAKQLMINILASDPELLAALERLNETKALGSPLIQESLPATANANVGDILGSNLVPQTEPLMKQNPLVLGGPLHADTIPHIIHEVETYKGYTDYPHQEEKHHHSNVDTYHNERNVGSDYGGSHTKQYSHDHRIHKDSYIDEHYEDKHYDHHNHETIVHHQENEYPDHSGDHEHLSGHDVSKPKITKHSLAAPPGCKSEATRTCHKVPVYEEKKKPVVKCREVPTVDCFYVLKNVPDIECAPSSYEDCRDVVKEVPYITTEEECEDVPYEECVEVEEQVPVQVCTQVDIQRETITTNVGISYRNDIRSASASASRSRRGKGRSG